MQFLEYPDREMLFLSLADRLASELGQALRSGGTAALTVPGGTTPGPLFDLLCEVDLDWANVAVMLNDERWVPEDDPRSNTALLRGRLLRRAAAPARLVPLWLAGQAPGNAAPLLSAGVAPWLPLTSAVLGMGADMHTASLFPGAEGLAEALAPGAPPVLALQGGNAPEPRVTLTAPVLAGALHVHLLILGAEKRAALEAASRLRPEQAPVRAVLDNATVHWAE